MVILGAMDYYFTFHITKSQNHTKDTFDYIITKTQVAFLISIVGIFTAYTFLPNDVFALSLILFVPVFLNGLSAFITYAQAQRMAKLIAMTQISFAFVFLVSKIVLVLLNAPLKYFILIQALDGVATSLILGYYFLFIKKWKFNIGTTFPVFDFKSTFKFLYDIRYNLVLVGFWQLVMRADQLILAKMSNAYTLGIYSAAVKLAEAPNAIVTVLGIVVFPRVAKQLNIKNLSDSGQVNKYRNLYVLSGILITTFLFVFAPFIIRILYGDKFLESVDVLRVYSLSITGLFISYYYMIVCGATEEKVRPAIIAVISALINISLVIILTHFYGILGTAAASAISYSVSGAMFYFVFRKK